MTATPSLPIGPADLGDTVVVRLRTPGDVVASLPALLGYHPTTSAVLIVLGGTRQRVRLTMRVDLPPPRLWKKAALVLADGAARAAGDTAVLALVDATPADGEAARRQLDRALAKVGVTLADVLVVADGRYRSLLCTDQSCCPEEGRPVPSSSALSAAAVVQGRTIGASRADLAREFAPPVHKALDDASRVTGLLESTIPHGSVPLDVDGVFDELDRACDAVRAGDLALEQAVRLAVMISVGSTRDVAYLHLVSEGEQIHRQVWGSVCRAVPPEYSVVPLVLFSLSAYLMGEGALANVALDRAREVDCAHPAVELVHDLLAACIPPQAVRDALGRSTISGH